MLLLALLFARLLCPWFQEPVDIYYDEEPYVGMHWPKDRKCRLNQSAKS